MRSQFTLILSFALLSTSAQTNCDSLIIEQVSYSAFSDSLIEIVATNTSTHNFIYPGFILFAQNGDTIAMEQVNFSDIGQQQVHRLTIKSGAMLPTGPFQGTLELWNGFYTNLECSYSFMMDLCPQPPCASIFPYIGNFGGALVNATYSWELLDSTQSAVAFGQFLLAGAQQEDQDSACVPPGSYTITVTGPTQATGGQLVFGASAYGNMGGVQGTFMQAAGPQSIPFEFYPLCTNIVDQVAAQDRTNSIQFLQRDQELIINDPSNKPLGLIQLINASGRIILEERVVASSTQLSIKRMTTGVHLVLVPERSAQWKLLIR